MKNYRFFLPAVSIVVIITSLVFTAPKAVAQNPSKAGRGISIPDDVNKIITKSCIACHSDSGKKMAKAVLNFSKWDTYARRAQVQKRKAICSEINKGKMPPPMFSENNPELALSKDQKKLIFNWGNFVPATKK